MPSRAIAGRSFIRAASSARRKSEIMEQEDLAGLLMLIVILVVIVIRCAKPSSQADRLSPLKSVFELLDSNGEGSVDSAEFFDAIHTEAEMKSVFAGDSVKAALKEVDKQITWPDFIAWVNKRSAKNK